MSDTSKTNPDMPITVKEMTRRLIDADVAHRLLTESQRSLFKQDSSGYLFWVEVLFDTKGGPTYTVVMQYPPHGYREAFDAVRGATFGATGEKRLSDLQMDLIEQLVAEERTAATDVDTD